MSITLIHYDAGSGPAWGVVRGAEIVALPGEYPTTADVLGEAAKLARSLITDADVKGIDPATVRVLPPVPEARVYCQGANYRSHMLESGMDPDRSFNMLFTKSTASLTGPHDDIVKPPHVQLLDYEIELGIVIGKAITGPVNLTEADLTEYVGAFVVANDVSARDVQLSQGQWYKGKSYRTFCPVGPYLCVPDPDEVLRWRDLRLTLSVNGEPRQDSLAGDMVFPPAATLSEFSRLETFQVGDLLLTGTPGGVALQPPKAVAQRVVGLLPEAKKWQLFVRAQAKRGTYLKPGDRITASIRTADGALDLGTQHNAVR